MRRLLSVGGNSENRETIGAVADLTSGEDIRFYVSGSESSTSLESLTSVVYEDHPAKYIWETGCLLRCELPITFPVYVPVKNPPGKFIDDRSLLCVVVCVILFLLNSDLY